MTGFTDLAAPAFLALARSLHGRTAPAPASSPYAAAARVMKQRRPDLAAGIIAGADRALAGELVLPGTGGKPFFVGDPPRWHENPVDDKEYVWLLNRMSHWNTLLRAHALTGDARYAERVAVELSDWIAQCPPPPLDLTHPDWSAPWGAVSPWRILEAGIRSFNAWATVQQELVETGLLEPAPTVEYLRSTYDHARILATVSPRVWPDADHNHFVMEMLGLLSICQRLPQLDPTSAWRNLAQQQFVRAIAQQITPGGGQIEASPHYHNVCVDLMATGFRIAGADGLGEGMRAMFRSAVEHAVFCTRADFATIPVGDSDPILDSINSALYGCLVLKETHWLAHARDLAGRPAVEKHIWDMVWDRPDALALLDALPAASVASPRATRLTHHATGTHQAVIRSGWTREDRVLFLHGKPPYTDGRAHLGGHAHIEPGNIDFSAFGRPLLADPGRYTYRESADRYEFKRAASHNCLLVNDRDPYAYVDSWRFGKLGAGALEHVWETPRFSGASCFHSHYGSIVCRRIAGLVDGGLLVVLDEVTGLATGDTIQRYFHLDTVAAELTPAGAAARFPLPDSPDVLLACGWTGGDGARLLPGRVSTAIDVAHETRRLCIETRPAADSIRLAAAFLPAPGDQPPALAISAGPAGWRITLQNRSLEIAVESFSQCPSVTG